MPHQGKLIISVLLASLAYLIWVVIEDASAVWEATSKVGWLGLCLVLAMSIANYLIRFCRWQWYLHILGHRIPLLASCRYYFAGFALTTTPGKAGEAIRTVFLSNHGVPHKVTFAALISERLTDIASVTLIAAIGILALSEFQWIAVIMFATFVVLILFIYWKGLRHFVQKLASRYLSGKFLAVIDHGIALVENAALMLHGSKLVVGILLGLVAWGAEALAFAYIVHVIGYPLPIHVLASVYALSMLAGAISFMPGGLGGAEAAMGAMLLGLGLSGPAAVSATVLCRLATLWFAVALGMIALGGSTKKVAAEMPAR